MTDLTDQNNYATPDLPRTGSEHYRFGEALADQAHNHYSDAVESSCSPFQEKAAALSMTRCRLLTGLAQVHAQLATAAAAALPTITQHLGDADEVTQMGHAIGWTPPRHAHPESPVPVGAIRVGHHNPRNLYRAGLDHDSDEHIGVAFTPETGRFLADAANRTTDRQDSPR